MADKPVRSPAFCMALGWLVAGRRVARASWIRIEGSTWIEIVGRDWPPKTGAIMKVSMVGDTRIATPWRANSADLLAEDWMRLGAEDPSL